MEETAVLLLLSAVMLGGSYLSGSIPLNVSMSEEKLKKVTVLGAGLLVGTALAVVIPEGINALLPEPHSATVTSASSAAVHAHSAPAGEEAGHSNLHAVIGIALVFGFVFMLVVDQISSNMNDILGENNITAMIGLVVHAAADGIALGAAATTSHADVEIIVFLAIMLHKAPAAFGLVTFLMHKGIERNRIRKYLLVFSCAAPLLTILTYFGIGQEGKETLSSVNATGIVMLFSAGTFLYVATVHVLPELMQENQHWHSLPTSEGQANGPIAHHAKASLKGSEFVMLVIGTFLPLLLSAGHHH